MLPRTFILAALAANLIVIVPGRAETTMQALGPAVPETNLDAYRGGQALSIGDIDAVFNDLQVNGQANGNSAAGNTNGNNAISNDAFSNASGLTTVIQNTGNNVLIQNATILNFRLE